MLRLSRLVVDLEQELTRVASLWHKLLYILNSQVNITYMHFMWVYFINQKKNKAHGINKKYFKN